MGYSTTFYAVDIANVVAAIGSGDSDLLQTLKAATVDDPDDGGTSPELDLMTLTPDSTLCIDHEDIQFDGRAISAGEVPTMLCGSEIAILDIVVRIPSRVSEDVLRTIHECFPDSGIEKILIRYECDNPKTAKNLSPGPFLFRPMPDVDEDDNETDHVIASFSHVSHDAIADLVSGHLGRTDATHGQALELLCHVLGDRLPDAGLVGELSPLGLNLPLEHLRPPVPIRIPGDFPVISHLTAQETEQEARRLTALSMEFPDDPDIENARVAVRACVRAAASQSLGIVTFYQ